MIIDDHLHTSGGGGIGGEGPYVMAPNALHTVDQFRNSPAFIEGYLRALERSHPFEGDASVPMEIVRDLIKIIRGLVS